MLKRKGVGRTSSDAWVSSQISSQNALTQASLPLLLAHLACEASDWLLCSLWPYHFDWVPCWLWPFLAVCDVM